MAMNDRAQYERLKSRPKDRDSMILDLLGRKINTSSSLQMRITNHQALLSKYDFLNWLARAKFEQLLKVSHDEFWALIAKDCLVAKTSLKSTLDVVDTLARVMASAITMRRASWLQNLSIMLDVHQAIEDLPFDDRTLFLYKTDETLHSFKDSRSTFRSVEMYMPPMHRCSNNCHTGCSILACSPSSHDSETTPGRGTGLTRGNT
ncbi:hypothetical protein KIL84_010490 [Mauremys mutica]|uniref:Uncharacterized protein n=1 Tax=Mauremys mutica TaxID=74926 RepID=A0A9D4B030_9SAUR|nr:hypothetical protein KIL84_010490 [Mauremys mutica]